MKIQLATPVKCKTVDENVLVHDLQQQRLHVLNATAARVLALCDGTKDAGEIAASIAMEFHVSEDICRADVAQIVEQFKELGLIS